MAKKITANIPLDLLQSAQKVSGSGITETLIEGLRALSRQRAWTKFKKLKGKIELDIDLDLARERSYH